MKEPEVTSQEVAGWALDLAFPGARAPGLKLCAETDS